MANSTDPDETAHRHESSHPNLHCFAKVYVLVCRNEMVMMMSISYIVTVDA